MSSAKIIRKELRKLEEQAAPVESFREMTKTVGGRMTDFGKDFLALCKQYDVQQSVIAKLLDVSPGAVSQHYNR